MIEVSTEGFQGIKDGLKKAQNVIKAPSVGFAIGELLRKDALKRLRKEKKAPDGTPWKELSQTYQEYLDKHRIKGSKLLRSSTLMQSVGYSLERFPEGIISLSAGGRAQVGGKTLAYAATHQYGDERRKIPARPFLGMSKGASDMIEELLFKRIGSAMEGK